MPRVSYINVPDLVERLLEPLIDAHSWVLPQWVTALDFMWDDKLECPMQVQVHREYRAIRIIVGEQFASTDDNYREEAIIHEFVHASLMAMKAVQHDLLEAMDIEESNPKLFRWATNVINLANEGATQDMTDVILRRIREPKILGIKKNKEEAPW